jgi:hypothetical protein
MNRNDVPEVYTEPWIYWLQAAQRQAESTRHWRKESERDLPIGPELVNAVLEELPAAMQAISAAAFAIDGFDGAVEDIISLPKSSGPRAKRIVERLGFLIERRDRLKEDEHELRWLFETRNKSVHGKVWKDPTFRHRSGLSVSAAQATFCLESAERALTACQSFIAECLRGARANEQLCEWAAMRLARCGDLLG